MSEEMLYDEICSKRFDSIEGKQDKVLEILQGNGKPGLIQRIQRLEDSKTNSANWAEQFGPILGVVLKNWKVAAVIFVLLTTTLGSIKQGKTYTIDDLKQIIKQVQETELDGKAVETAPVEKEKQIY